MISKDDSHQSSEDVIRTSVVNWLTEEYGYSRDEIMNEVLLPGRRNIRADLVIYRSKDGKEPFIVIETKSRPIKPSIIQDFLLNYKDVKTEYLMLTNGSDKMCFRFVDGETIEIPDIPKKGELSTRISRDTLKPAKNLDYVLWNIMNLIRTSRLCEDDYLKEVDKLILCKIVDEKTGNGPLKFAIDPIENGNLTSPDAQVIVSNRINSLFEKAKKEYPGFFDANERIRLDPSTLVRVVSTLQSYSITMADPDVVSDFYEGFLRRSPRERTAFGFNPKEIVEFLINLTDPTINDRILDPYCGSGDFILSSMLHVWKKIDSSDIANEEKQNAKLGYSQSKLFAFDANQNMVSTSKIKLLLHGDGHSNVFQINFPYSDVPDKVKDLVKKEGFDLIIGKLPMDFSFGRNDFPESQLGIQTRKRQPIVSIYLEECLQMLKKGGRMAVIVPEGVLFSHGHMAQLRGLILSNACLRAVVSLPVGAFLQYGTSVKTSVLLIEKPHAFPVKEKYGIFMAELHEPNHKRKTLSSIERDLATILTRYRQFQTNASSVVASEPKSFAIKSSMLRTDWSVGRYVAVAEDTSSDLLSGITCGMEFFSQPKNFGAPTSTRHLEDVSSVSRGILARSDNYLYRIDAQDAIPYVRIGDMQNGTIAKSDLKYLQGTKTMDFAEASAKPGDVLFSIRGTIGKVALVPETARRVIAASQIAIIRVNKSIVSPEYLSIVLSSSITKEQVEPLTTGSIIRYLSVNDLRRIRIPVPPLSEQLNIVQKVRELRSKETQFDDEKESVRRRIDDTLRGGQQ